MTGKILALAVAALVSATPAAAACKLQKLAEVPVTMDGLRPIVDVKLNGRDARFLVDTGAFFGGVSDEAAARYGLKPSIAPFGMTIRGAGGGEAPARAVTADDFGFAGVIIHHLQFLVGGRVGPSDIAGMIGQNLLGAYDMEYDLANGVIRFFKADDCARDNLAYWSAGMALSRIPFDNPGRYVQSIRAVAKVNGQTIHVMLDSGASVSALNRNAAARAGVQPNMEGVADAGVTYGVYGRGMDTVIAPFSSFAIGDEEIKNTRLRVARIDLGDRDMLLGADFFLSHRILISKSQSKIYFTYNGGPVFRLDQAKSQAASTPPAATPVAATPVTAEEWTRRAAASAARRDFPTAIEAYTQAIALAPDNSANYQGRALARLNARQPVLAMADLGEALKRNPNDVASLMTRGELYLAAQDPVRARADFETAMAKAPTNRDLLLRVGYAYTRAGFYQEGVRQLDSWVAAHPKDENLPQVLGTRCWTRGAWGQELAAALADCDAALRKDRNAQVMQNRGLVLYRLGRTDEAITQYDEALKLQPRAAWSLYGRGLARLRKGLKAGGDADLQAAAAIAPGLPLEAKRYGLAPADPPKS